MLSANGPGGKGARRSPAPKPSTELRPTGTSARSRRWKIPVPNGIHLYKHRNAAGRTSVSKKLAIPMLLRKGCYKRADWDEELVLLEDLLKSLGASLETPYDENFVREKREAFAKERCGPIDH